MAGLDPKQSSGNWSRSVSDLILVSRLKALYWPADIVGHYSTRVILAARPVPRFRSYNRNLAYDLGRVHHMYNQLKAGKSLDPVELDWIWMGFSPARLDLLDGHHRFVAHILARKKRIPAIHGGPVDALEWLKGERSSAPGWF